VRTTRGGQSALLLLDVADILRQENIDYAVIGAFALSVHGALRASTDVDALLCVSPARLKRLEGSLRTAGFDASARPGRAEDPIQGLLLITDGHGNSVDLLGGLAGMDPGLFARTIRVPFAGAELCFAGREDLIAMKCYAGGPQDLADARSAYEGSQGPLDVDLLRLLSRRFGREAANRLEQLLAFAPAPIPPNS
jgi:hypothetical protein